MIEMERRRKETLKKFFENVKTDLERRNVNRVKSSRIVFNTECCAWKLICAIDGTVELSEYRERTRSDNNQGVDSNCTVDTSLFSLYSIATGELTPMSAYLNGSIKILGNKNVLREFASSLKRSIVKIEKCSNELNNALRVDVKASEYFNINVVDFISSHDKKFPTPHTLGEKPVVYYILEVTDLHSGNKWTILRRFSSFVKLRAALIPAKFKIPVIANKSSILLSQLELIQSRIKTLGEYITNVLKEVPIENSCFRKFLCVKQQDDSRDPSLKYIDGCIQSIEFSQSLLDIWRHAWSKDINWNYGPAAQTISILIELMKVKKTLTTFRPKLDHFNLSFETNTFLLSVEKIVVSVSMVLVCVDFVSDSTHSASIYDTIYRGFVRLLGLFFVSNPSTMWKLLGFLVCTVIFDTLIKHNLNEILFVKTENTTNSSVASILLNDSANTRWPIFGLITLITTQLYSTLVSINNFRKYQFTSTEWLSSVAHFPCIMCVGLLRDSSIRRSIMLYSFGFSLIVMYGVLKFLCIVCRLSPSSQDSLYEYVDRFVAPFFSHQISVYRSIFIKFAQYFSARADFMNPLWVEELSKLQDSCPPSGRAYVIKQIEQDLNSHYVTFEEETESNSSSIGATQNKLTTLVRLKDVFEDFSYEPIASASIGQVHSATLNMNSLKRVYNKQAFEEKIPLVSLFDVINKHQRIIESSLTNAMFSTYFTSTPSTAPSALNFENAKIQVAVKIQHENIRKVMLGDMTIMKRLTKVAGLLDSRWKALQPVLEGWEKSLIHELDFNTEADNLREVSYLMRESQLGCVTPIAIPGLVFTSSFTMTFLHGFKVTDKLALDSLQIDRPALLNRLAHAAAYQLLVVGVFNADPHPGNILICLTNQRSPLIPLSTSGHFVNYLSCGDSTQSRLRSSWKSTLISPSESARSSDHRNSFSDDLNSGSNNSDLLSSVLEDSPPTCATPVQVPSHAPSISPGLLDFGMTVRINNERRRLYCQLLNSLFEGDDLCASDALKKLGYETNQSSRAPERDARFFAYLFRDSFGDRATSQRERKELLKTRNNERKSDESAGEREKGGRSIASLPEDFLFVERTIGLIRGLSVELGCECEILTILALHAKAGLLKDLPSWRSKQLKILTVSCSKLVNMEIIPRDKNDVYVVLKWGDTTIRTITLDNVGEEATFEVGKSLQVTSEYYSNICPPLQVSVFDANRFRADGHIGSAEISSDEFLLHEGKTRKLDLALCNNLKSNNKCGELSVTLKFVL